MTFSLLARDEETGAFGMVISSSSPAVAARCLHLRAGVGAVASQNVTDPRLGPRLLDALAGGASAEVALAFLEAPFLDWRQIMLLDARGRCASFEGSEVLGAHAVAPGTGAIAGGNLLAHEGVPQAMLAGYLAASGPFGDRLVAALQAGLEAGGEAGPVHSAGLGIVRDQPFPYADLRVDWSDDPIGDLAALWCLYAPQADAYEQRALDPRRAPGYGVPGDE